MRKLSVATLAAALAVSVVAIAPTLRFVTTFDSALNVRQNSRMLNHMHSRDWRSPVPELSVMERADDIAFAWSGAVSDLVCLLPSTLTGERGTYFACMERRITAHALAGIRESFEKIRATTSRL